MNSTANASSEFGKCSILFSSKAVDIGGIVAFCLILLVTLAGNSLSVMLVYKTPNLRKPIKLFHRKHGLVRFAVYTIQLALDPRKVEHIMDYQ